MFVVAFKRSNFKSRFYFSEMNLFPESSQLVLHNGQNFLKIFVQVPADITLKMITLHSTEIAQINLRECRRNLSSPKLFVYLVMQCLSSFFFSLRAFTLRCDLSTATDKEFINFFWRETFCTLVLR
jgi:hypothetical protein